MTKVTTTDFKAPCPKCGIVCEQATGLRTLQVGDVVVCIECAAVNVVTDTCSLRAMTAAELAEIHPDMRHSIDGARAFIRARRLRAPNVNRN